MNVLVRSALLRRRSLLAVLALASIWLAMLLFGAGPLDRKVYQALYSGQKPVMLEIARILTFLGEPTVLIGAGFVVSAWIWWRMSGRVAITLLFVILIGRGLSELQKYWIDRPRPDIEPHLVAVKTSSFPSGHSTSSMIFYLTLALALTARTQWTRPAAAAAVCLSLLIGISRVMLGVHWPSDVIAGWSFGLLWVIGTLGLSERLLKA